MIKTIISTNEIKIIVDEYNYDWLNGFNWLINGWGYATCRISDESIVMHRIILEKKLGRSLIDGEMTDHINQNKLDNREENLRLANRALNQHNSLKRDYCSSNHKGVNLMGDKGRTKPWRASINFKGEKFLKYFKTEIEAAEWYKEMSKKFYG